MRIVITGASGFIGREIVSLFQKENIDLLLIGRDPEKLRAIFPGLAVASYEDIAVSAKGYDALVHLAVRNNDQPGTLDEFRKANVDLMQETLEAAKTAGIKTFINTTTLHASQNTDRSPYAQSKREAEDVLSREETIAVVNLRLPAVYGSVFKGRLSVLDRVPHAFRPMAFQILAALKPTVHAKKVAAAILAAARSGKQADFIISDRQEGNVVYHGAKRVLDMSFAVFVIGALWWALLGAWITVKLTSPGPGIFAQQRVGKGGGLFTCYKFRTMGLGTKEAATHEVTADSVTTVGRFLRKTKIDELPQVWNILKNELSLVGPRPCLPVQQELVSARTDLGVLDENGGITGWAQIRNVDMSDPVRLAKLDAEYLALRTIPLDLKIILATATGHGQGDKIR